MKALLEKIRGIKGGIWVLALFLCAGALLLLPKAQQSGAAMTTEEQRISATLSQIAGAGETRVSIYYAAESGGFSSAARRPAGAVAVAQGAGDVGVRLELLRALQALLGLPGEAVEVFSMEAAPQ